MIVLVLCDISLAMLLLGLYIQNVSQAVKHPDCRGYLFAQLCFALLGVFYVALCVRVLILLVKRIHEAFCIKKDQWVTSRARLSV